MKSYQINTNYPLPTSPQSKKTFENFGGDKVNLFVFKCSTPDFSERRRNRSDYSNIHDANPDPVLIKTS